MNFAKIKTKILFCLSFLILTSVSISLGGYVIANLTINGENTIEIGTNEDKTNFHKIEFRDGNTSLKIMYVKDGEKITTDDIPDNYKDAKFEWISSDGDSNNNFTLINNSFSNGLTVTKDLVLTKNDILANQGTTTPNTNNFVNDPNDAGDSTISTSNGKVTINQGNNKGSIITMDEPILNNVDFDLNFKTIDSNGNESSSQNIEQSLGDNGATQHSTDKTIGLEDPYSNRDIYKPRAGGSSSLNPLVTRLKLESDTLLIGNSWLGVGARTGFFGGSGWSQIGYQGLINGSYCELDLNGKTLIIGNGATLELRGSLIDSSPNKTGMVVVEEGGTVISTFVIEDHYHETSLPIAYLYGDAPFKMYRMPYLTAKLKMNKGSFLRGYLRFDMGGDGNNNYVDNILNIIGDSDNYMINTSECKDDSYILREPSWDDFWFPNNSSENNEYNTETETISSIVYEKFNYEFHNCGSVKINNPTLEPIPYKIALTTISFQIFWDRCDFYIPPYFSFYLYNSNVEIRNNIVFMPGSYLYVDENSSIALSSKSFNRQDLYSVDGDFMGIIESRLPGKFKYTATFQSVGGLMFLKEKPYWNDSRSGWTDANSEDSYNAPIFSGTTKFRAYQNLNKPSKCDFYGKIIFSNNALYKEKYHLGGEINFYNLEEFMNSYNSSNSNVLLFNSIFATSACHFEPDGSTVFYNGDYYTVYPLISENNVLTDLTTRGLRNNAANIKYSFDDTSGLIQTNSGAKYAYTFVNNNGVYNNWSNQLNKAQYNNYSENNYLNATDDLDIRFYEIRNESDNVVTMNVPMYSGDTNTYQFIYFRGSFFRFNENKVDIFKFKGPNPGSNNNGWSDAYTINVIYKNVSNYYLSDRWMLN